MELTLNEAIQVNLGWSYDTNSRKTGVFEDEMTYSCNKYTLHYFLRVSVEVEEDEGDYWNPPTFSVVDETTHASDLRVYDLMETEVLLEETDKLKLYKQLEELITYE